MTNRQASEDRSPRLDPGTVIRTALELLDEKGLDALSTRAVADRLGVRMNTVLWHVKTKARMLELMADAVVGEAPLDDLPASWDERVRELARRYRRALLAHRDGATLVVGTYAAQPHTLRFADTLVAALLDGGLDERESAWTTWTIIYLALGLTQEEQAATRQPPNGRLVDAVSETAYPALHRALGHLDTESFGERFEFGLSAILARR
ncbi:TetR/AcrR family transcriptional regulator C-terminal domain-containing protein [Streptomyces fulvorobeus]|uniref:TetR family transcriptional regulator n=1 Tax=Streptomyces fulvorobeus TaxID=284028 RepID=A0A7J0CGT1_9ACTN|nr:TetR/AcrR family transcriptional regulator C-terminal domain-containing protein [Streptomyces fulvorobeus]NYE44584.1 TetR/AcrR family tetracycline transcriptional repressor [Streptomyces fulvorobeus]GFN01124.1 TetR family transcriptional regulator [Streptomyces fulvorobeus]